jgi:hypothetical protein
MTEHQVESRETKTTPEQREAARRAVVRAGAEDLLPMIGLTEETQW